MNLYSLFDRDYYQAYVDLKSEADSIRSQITAEMIQSVKAAVIEIQSGKRVIEMFIDGDNLAHIPIVGQLVDKSDWCAAFFGEDQTVYGDIVKMIEKAEESRVDGIIFDINSPGGYVSMCDNTAMAIAKTPVPTEGRIHDMCASACYWLGAQMDILVAMTPAAEIGSIGVIAEYISRKKQNSERGIKRYVFTSTDAPNKFNDIDTESGRARIINRLNEIHNVFRMRVAEGRVVTEKKVNEDFGRGGVLIASKALEAGMIDKVIGMEIKAGCGDKKHQAITINKPPKGEINKQEVNMELTFEQLKSDFPALFDKAKQEGVDQERERSTGISALLKCDYPPSIKTRLIGKIESGATLESAADLVAGYDAAKETEKQKEAIDESGELKSTPDNQATSDGIIRTEEDLEKARVKAGE